MTLKNPECITHSTYSFYREAPKIIKKEIDKRREKNWSFIEWQHTNNRTDRFLLANGECLIELKLKKGKIITKTIKKNPISLKKWNEIYKKMKHNGCAFTDWIDRAKKRLMEYASGDYHISTYIDISRGLTKQKNIPLLKKVMKIKEKISCIEHCPHWYKKPKTTIRQLIDEIEKIEETAYSA